MSADLKRLVAVRLRDARAKVKQSQSQLAASAGLSVSYIGMLERAERLPQLEALSQLAKALKLPVSYFVSDDIVANQSLRYARYSLLFSHLERLNLRYADLQVVQNLVSSMFDPKGTRS